MVVFDQIQHLKNACRATRSDMFENGSPDTELLNAITIVYCMICDREVNETVSHSETAKTHL